MVFNEIYRVTRPGGFLIVSNITEGAKRKVESTQAAIESDLLYPLLRGRDVQRWVPSPSAYILMTQDPKTRIGINEEIMKVKYSKTYSYLKRFEATLRARKTQAVRHLMDRGPFYSIFGVSDFTFAPWKVVWREVGNEINAAVVNEAPVENFPRPVIPDHTCVFVSCKKKEEAHYICAVLNSTPARMAIKNYIVLHPDPHVLDNIGIPSFTEKNRIHLKLAHLSEAAHEAAMVGGSSEINRIEEEIDHCAALLWELTDQDVREIQRSLEMTA